MKALFSCMGVFFVCFFMVACDNNSERNNSSSKADIVLENIFSRKSVRKYTTQQVEEEKIDLLLKAGMAAPSGMNIRPWEFVVVNEKATLEELATSLPYAKMLTDAQCAIVVCGDSIKSFYWYLDCSAATQNILLAAEAMGLGAVWTAAYPYEDRMEVVKKQLSLPDHVLPLCVIPIGYPQGVESAKDKFDQSKVHFGTY